MNIVAHSKNKQLSKDYASELLELGSVRIPISQREQDLIGVIQEEYPQFLNRRPTIEERLKWRFTVPGEDEADEGLIIRDGTGGYDTKVTLHIRPTTEGWVRRSGVPFYDEDRIFFSHHDDLFQMSLEGVLSLTGGIDGLGIFEESFQEMFRECYQNIFPYAAPVNRQLDYPSQKGERRAGVHIDRSALTRHMGDVGGYLFASNEQGEDLGNISPKPGEVLYFFGVKAYVVSRGKIEPFWHGSKAKDMERRLAIPHFAHVRTKKFVKTASKTYRSYKKQFKHLA